MLFKSQFCQVALPSLAGPFSPDSSTQDSVLPLPHVLTAGLGAYLFVFLEQLLLIGHDRANSVINGMLPGSV